METLVRYEHHAAVATITLATRAIDNALNPEAASQLDDCIRRAGEDSACRAVVIASDGPKFCTGMDLSAVARARDGASAFASALLRICESPKPFLAHVEGDVAAGGLGLMAACDIVIAGRDVTLALTEAIVGMVPLLISPVLMRRLTPASFGYLALSTRHVTAAEAHNRGLVDEVCDSCSRTALNRQLDRLLHCSPGSLARSKQIACPLDLRAQVESALLDFNRWMQQSDLLAELEAFTNGLAPSWFRKYKG